MTMLQRPSCIVFPRPVGILPLSSVLRRTHRALDACATQIHIRFSVHHRELPSLGGLRVLRTLLSRVLVPSGGFQMYATLAQISPFD